MEVEEKTSPVTDDSDENNSKKGKILTLLFPAESQPAEGKESKKDKSKPLSKIVIRRLPPKLTQEGFIEEFSPLPAHDYFSFVRGDLNLGAFAFSRAYINCLNQDEMFAFKEKFDDYAIQDEKGKTYHAVVEFAPFQKIPKRSPVKKKLSKAGTLESDPKYLEFLQKLEESKNFTSNPSEYFHETESSSTKTKVVTTPLLEYLKKKRQKKIDLKNEIRQKKREAEKEKRKKEEERRKVDREKRKEDKKISDNSKPFEDKEKKVEEQKNKKVDDHGKLQDDKKDSKNRKVLEGDSVSEEQLDTVIPNDPAILKVVVRQSDKIGENDAKTSSKIVSNPNDEPKPQRSSESEISVGKPERKYSDFRTRLSEEKQRKTFYRRDSEPSKTFKTTRKGVPDEKGDNCWIGTEVKDLTKKPESSSDSKRYDNKIEVKETKSKFRYSEQRNRDREYRQKTSDGKNSKESFSSDVDFKVKSKDADSLQASNIREGKMKKSSSEQEVDGGDECLSSRKFDQISILNRRKSLEIEREVVDAEKKRSKSFHDVSSKEFWIFKSEKKLEKDRDRGRDMNTPENESVQTDSKESTESEKLDDDSKKDPRSERRIRNKDRPSIEIYRPGMGKFSKQRLEQRREDSNSKSATGISYSGKYSRYSNKPINRKSLTHSETSESRFSNKNEDSSQSELRTMTFKRTTSREN